MAKLKRLEIRVSADNSQGDIDGYAELILGVMALSGILVDQKLSKRVTDQRTEIYISLVTRDAPLGHMGLDDIKDAE